MIEEIKDEETSAEEVPAEGSGFGSRIGSGLTKAADVLMNNPTKQPDAINLKSQPAPAPSYAVAESTGVTLNPPPMNSKYDKKGSNHSTGTLVPAIAEPGDPSGDGGPSYPEDDENVG